MKIVAKPERTNPPTYFRGSKLVELPLDAEYEVVKVEIGVRSTTVTVIYGKLPMPFNSVHFNYELVLDGGRELSERRVKIDIVDDLLRDTLTWPIKRWVYSDDMPQVTTDYVIVPD